jgi:hypothetical protein
MNGDISVRMRDLEEKNRILKDRTLLIGENLIESKEDLEKDILELKTKIDFIEKEILRLKSIIETIMDETSNFARKSQLDIIERQMEMFSPLELVREKDMERVVKGILNAKKKVNK